MISLILMLGTLGLLAQVSEEVQSPESLSAKAGDSVSISCTGTSGVDDDMSWRQPPSPASSYTSALSSAPAMGKWTGRTPSDGASPSAHYSPTPLSSSISHKFHCQRNHPSTDGQAPAPTIPPLLSSASGLCTNVAAQLPQEPFIFPTLCSSASPC
ncbi:hypothetical protein Q8A67_015678 [Cirrhinus molitorella]|uniref:Ig-like domain-containing protein n=1 Tax=Cirrhinus molitorella TaxID=172907 RepID=A0AA88TKB0_9TELE|nr:hypothetical protein Q8A67_015678 [Cirrhinus molitorella]